MHNYYVELTDSFHGGAGLCAIKLLKELHGQLSYILGNEEMPAH